MYRRQRLGANSTHFFVLLSIILQVIHISESQSEVKPQFVSSSSLEAFQSKQKMPPAYVNGLLSLKGSLLTNNFQLKPIVNSNIGNRELGSHLDFKMPPQTDEAKQLLAEAKYNFRELNSNIAKSPQKQEDSKQLLALQERNMDKDKLHQQLDQLQLELRKQDDQLSKQDMELAAQVSATSAPLQQMPGPVHPPIEQLAEQSQGLQPVLQSSSQLLDLPQSTAERDTTPLVVQADGESNCYAKMQLLQQLAEHFGQSQPQQLQQQSQQQQQQLQQQAQQQQQPQQLRSNLVQLSALEADAEEDDEEQCFAKANTTEQCDETTRKPKSTTTKKPTTRKLPCCSKKPKHKKPKQRVKKDQDGPQLKRSFRHTTMKPNLRIDAIATLIRYRNKQNDPNAAQLNEPQRPLHAQLGKNRRKQKSRWRTRLKSKTRKERGVVTRKQLLQAEIKLWPIKIAH
ncbi:putative mediator of RNA polymerase II transcription subunit 26 [Drosophila sulfurigaster albostrigata]|uniref:putative mediator of RNA polymerase II transcription subunit 26 n=1 Tax=Drosophila sulfurigaster albostrigata TaxID=89887 RepID=UPI002D2195BF|nr:putative mediator of RNA polymerase II transcription subunit 26 [Drosophila sulfurigaster albostrigata]